MQNTTAIIPEPLAVSPERAASMVGLGRTKFFELLANHEIHSVKSGRRTLVPVEALRAYLKRLGEQQKKAA